MRTHSGIDGNRLVLLGHSVGAGATLLHAARMATLPRVRCPVLLVHGRSDTTVPVDEAQRLLGTCAHARLMLVDGGHDLRDGLAVHGAELVEFLHSACATFQVWPPANRSGLVRQNV